MKSVRGRRQGRKSRLAPHCGLELGPTEKVWMRNDLGAWLGVSFSAASGNFQECCPGPEGLFPHRLCELQTPPRLAGGRAARLSSASRRSSCSTGSNCSGLCSRPAPRASRQKPSPRAADMVGLLRELIAALAGNSLPGSQCFIRCVKGKFSFHWTKAWSLVEPSGKVVKPLGKARQMGKINEGFVSYLTHSDARPWWTHPLLGMGLACVGPRPALGEGSTVSTAVVAARVSSSEGCGGRDRWGGSLGRGLEGCWPSPPWGAHRHPDTTAPLLTPCPRPEPAHRFLSQPCLGHVGRTGPSPRRLCSPSSCGHLAG